MAGEGPYIEEPGTPRTRGGIAASEVHCLSGGCGHGGDVPPLLDCGGRRGRAGNVSTSFAERMAFLSRTLRCYLVAILYHVLPPKIADSKSGREPIRSRCGNFTPSW